MTWTERLQSLIADPSRGREKAARDYAERWPTCAVGEYREVLESRGMSFSEDGRPTNDDLIHLGAEFYAAVKNEQYRYAIEVIEKIKNYTWPPKWGRGL